jgi:hypothetical protein
VLDRIDQSINKEDSPKDQKHQPSEDTVPLVLPEDNMLNNDAQLQKEVG